MCVQAATISRYLISPGHELTSCRSTAWLDVVVFQTHAFHSKTVNGGCGQGGSPIPMVTHIIKPKIIHEYEYYIGFAFLMVAFPAAFVVFRFGFSLWRSWASLSSHWWILKNKKTGKDENHFEVIHGQFTSLLLGSPPHITDYNTPFFPSHVLKDLVRYVSSRTAAAPSPGPRGVMGNTGCSTAGVQDPFNAWHNCSRRLPCYWRASPIVRQQSQVQPLPVRLAVNVNQYGHPTVELVQHKHGYKYWGISWNVLKVKDTTPGNLQKHCDVPEGTIMMFSSVFPVNKPNSGTVGMCCFKIAEFPAPFFRKHFLMCQNK